MALEQAKKTERYVVVSLAVHVALLFCLVTGNILFPSSAKVFLPSIQIDMVALPNEAKTNVNQVVDSTLPIKDKTPPPAPKVEPKPVEPPVAKPIAAAVPIAKPVPVKAAKIKDPEKKAESAIEKLRREVQKAKTDKQQKEQADLKKFQDNYRSATRGNQTHQGTNTNGTMEATQNAYAAHISDQLRSNWSLPVWLQSTGLRAVVRLFIDARGNVVNYQFVQKSGNDAFDDCVKAAIQKSSPFAPPPSEMARGLRSGNLEVTFPI